MNRREFLLRGTIYGTTLLMGNPACASVQPTVADKEANLIAGMRIIDPHQHPDKNPAASKDLSASYQYMKAIGAAAVCYSAIGDIHNMRYYAGLSTYDATLRQLRWWLD